MAHRTVAFVHALRAEAILARPAAATFAASLRIAARTSGVNFCWFITASACAWSPLADCLTGGGARTRTVNLRQSQKACTAHPADG